MEKNGTISKIMWYQKVYFLKLHMCVYLHTKYQVSGIILMSFRQGVILPPPLISKPGPKKLTQIRVKIEY